MIKPRIILKSSLLSCVFFAVMAFFSASADVPRYQTRYNNVIFIGNRAFIAELVSSPAARQKGMMYRPGINPEQAMVFIFQSPRRVSFWMQHVNMPLDMLFFDEKGYLKEIKANVPPCRVATCPTYPSQHDDIMFVVEIKAGQAAAQDIRIGDRLKGH